MATITENSIVILNKSDSHCISVKIRKGGKACFDRNNFLLDDIIGRPYGSTFEIQKGKLVYIEPEIEEPRESDGVTPNVDNRNLNDTDDSQKLTMEDINQLKKECTGGDEIIKQIVDNSSTFHEKTSFSQQKYLSRKKKKYVTRFNVLRPSLRIVAEMQHNKSAQKICHLRLDSLSQILTHCNVSANSNVLVVDGTMGLISAAILERTGGFSKNVIIHSGLDPINSVLNSFNFSEEQLSSLFYLPINELNCVPENNSKSEDNAAEVDSDNPAKKIKIDVSYDCADLDEINETVGTTKENGDTRSTKENGDTRSTKENGDTRSSKYIVAAQSRKKEREKRKHEARLVLEERNFDALVVVTKCHCTPLVVSLLDYLAPSRPLAVFSMYKEPLLNCYQTLKCNYPILNLKLTESWWRDYQVLPDRTRPSMKFDNCSGYLLTGLRVTE